MSHVEFKKWRCPTSLSLRKPYFPCRIFKMAMSHVTIGFPPSCFVTKPSCRMSNFRNGRVAVPNLVVQTQKMRQKMEYLHIIRRVLESHFHINSGRFSRRGRLNESAFCFLQFIREARIPTGLSRWTPTALRFKSLA